MKSKYVEIIRQREKDQRRKKLKEEKRCCSFKFHEYNENNKKVDLGLFSKNLNYTLW